MKKFATFLGFFVLISAAVAGIAVLIMRVKNLRCCIEDCSCDDECDCADEHEECCCGDDAEDNTEAECCCEEDAEPAAAEEEKTQE